MATPNNKDRLKMTPIDYSDTFGFQGAWNEVYERAAYLVNKNLKLRWYQYSMLGL
jgi:hypothetical protein